MGGAYAHLRKPIYLSRCFDAGSKSGSLAPRCTQGHHPWQLSISHEFAIPMHLTSNTMTSPLNVPWERVIILHAISRHDIKST